MNMKDAIAAISASSTTKNAAKDQAWGGYIHKTTTGLATSDVTAGKYKLIFVQRDGDQYVFTYNGTTLGTWTYSGYIAKGTDGAKGTGDPVSSTALEMDVALMVATIGDGWITGKLADFEEARNGTGEW